MAPGRGYRHLCEIAAGGMGRVYVAVRRDDPEMRLFAVKRLPPHLRDDARARRTLTAEAEVAGGVEHRNVLRVLESGADVEGPFLAMEYVEGCSLAELVGAVKRMDEEVPLQVALDIAQQMAAGLHAIHEQVGGLLVVHRDVSPHNVLVDFEGRVRVADFGIAKSLNPEQTAHDTSTGVLKGKVGYMSPEQLRFEKPDRRSDLFALGVVLWELLAGRRLYHGSDGTEGARRILHEPPPDIGDEREDAPPEVVQLLFELLAKQPQTRPPSAAVVADRLEVSLEVLGQAEGRVHLGDYTASFFERERAARRKMIDAALERSHALDQAETQFGETAREPATREWHVKGVAISATVEYLQTVYGAEGFARVVEICPEDVRETLAGPVLVSGWYDGRVMVALTEAAQRLFSTEDETKLAARIGAAGADYAFGEGGPYEVFRQQGLREGVAPFLHTAGEIYRLYYDVGSWIVEEVTETAAVMRIVDGTVFPEAIADRIRGYLRRGFELIGCEEVHVTYLTDGSDLIMSARWRNPGGRPSRLPPL